MSPDYDLYKREILVVGKEASIVPFCGRMNWKPVAGDER